MSLYPQHLLSWTWLDGNCNSRPVTFMTGCSYGFTNARCCGYSDMSSWWWVEIPPETCRAVYRYIVNKLYIVASCWTIIGIYFTMHGLLNVKFIAVFFKEILVTAAWRRRNNSGATCRNNVKECSHELLNSVFICVTWVIYVITI